MLAESGNKTSKHSKIDRKRNVNQGPKVPSHGGGMGRGMEWVGTGRWGGGRWGMGMGITELDIPLFIDY